MTSTPPAPAEQPTNERSAARAIVAAMRPRQWAKNVLVFAAPLAAGELLSPDVFLVSVGAFVAFCLISSATYLVNDVRDVESDRAHPVKCSRPIAAGEVSTTMALILAAVLAVLALALAFTISPALGGVLVAYAVFTGAYSLFLKNEPVIELVLLAMGFLLRAIAGGVASGLPISEWFLIVAGFGSLFMAAGKRYGELDRLVRDGGSSEQSGAVRASLRGYTLGYLRFVWGVAAAVTITAYCLWAFDVAQTPSKFPVGGVECSALRAGHSSVRNHGGSWSGRGAGNSCSGRPRVGSPRWCLADLVRTRSGGRMTLESPLMATDDDRLLTGWGRTAPSRATVRSPSTYDEIAAAIQEAGPRGVLARGLGRSYGDAAQSGGATVFDMTGLHRFELDIDSGTVTADAGASIDEILRAIVPAGFFVPVTAGTRFVTVGGAIAADIHGKNHHVEGSFGSHVVSMRVVDGTGHELDLSPTDATTKDMFWATVGGMGLTGVIVEATFRLLAIETSSMSVDTVRCHDLDDVMARMIEGDDDYRYSVAWIDSVAPSGRGVLTRGDHARREQLTRKQVDAPLAYATPALPSAPAFIPNGLLNSASVRAFNEAWFRKHPKSRSNEIHSIPGFFHPLDGVRDWNRVYGPQGFLQYQFVVPDEAGWIVERTLSRLRDAGAPSFLTVLKRFGPANPAPLSFPQSGWTLAADVPAGNEALAPILDELDELVAEAGGRLYFAKDSRQSPSMVARTYPRLAEWHSVRDQMDPRGVFTSDLGRRLSL